MNSAALRLLLPALCLPVSLMASSLPTALTSLGAACRCQDPAKQDPAKQDPAKPKDELLDAEREKLRMKDVEAWKKLQVKSLDDVIDVKKTTQPIEVPASITEEEQTKVKELLQKAKDAGGGARTGRALREIEKMGYPGLVLLVNELREIDYKDTDSSMFGMQLNQTLTNITLGVNTGYVAIEIGVPMDPRKAQWNARTVQQWLQGVASQWPTREKFDEYIRARKAKKDAELEGETGDGKDKEKPKDKPKGDEKKGG